MTKKKTRSKKFNYNKRLSGILLHPTSLPGKYGIGDLGDNIYKFIDLLHKYNQHIWQILPLGPTGYGNSPYQCFSAFAGNPFLISIDKLIENKLLKSDDIVGLKFGSTASINYGLVVPTKWEILNIAFKRFNDSPKHPYHRKFVIFFKKNEFWLKDYSVFMAIKSTLNNSPWQNWPEQLRDKKEEAINIFLSEHEQIYNFHNFVQFLFFEQWTQVKNYCSKKEIIIIGDLPIFVSMDSADVWANRELFFIDEKGNPEVIAGVPPDYFSETGQRWGNPLYNWKIHKKFDYKWWKDRIKHIKSQVDLIRLDHFRGFEAYWEIPATEKTAINGKWIAGPGESFFKNLQTEFKNLPIIAENLGIITEKVENLRKQFHLPGMIILQFAFDEKYDEENPYLPHNYEPNNCIYTGTHDNDTIMGWFKTIRPAKIKMVEEYFNTKVTDIAELFIRECMKSVAKYAIFPLQDVLRLDNSTRMNFPGKETSNWEWRFEWNQIKEEFMVDLAKYTKLYNRM